ncbi:MAG: helix-turn-helix domain-containing protein [Bacteroidia bacterium]
MQSIFSFQTKGKSPEPYSKQQAALSRTEAFIKKVKHLIQVNLDNELFDAADLARQIHLSVSQLNRKLNATIQQPAGQLIWEIKMEHAARLLLYDVAPIGEVAYLVGYKCQAHFCRSFKRRYACTPSHFKKKYSAKHS